MVTKTHYFSLISVAFKLILTANIAMNYLKYQKYQLLRKLISGRNFSVVRQVERQLDSADKLILRKA